MTSTEKQLKDKDGNDITDANAVHKTGDETIEGMKTFKSLILSERTGSQGIIGKRELGYEVGVTPTTTFISDTIKILDRNDVYVMSLVMKVLTNNKKQLCVLMKNSDNTTLKTIVLAESD